MSSKNKENTTLDNYLDIDPNQNEKQDKEIEEVCKICGAPIVDDTFKRCRDCLNKLALIDDLNELLEYISPGESFRETDLINKGFKSLKLNMLISKFLKEQLILINLDGLFVLNDIKFLNNFIKKYGEKERPLKEKDFNIVDKKDESAVYIDINNYSDYVIIRFNPRITKWVVDFFNENKDLAHSKSFLDSEDANKEAIYYLKQLGVLGNSVEEDSKQEKESNKRKFSSHEGIYYSPTRGKWGAKVKGYKGFKFIGHFNSEEEAYEAREEYLRQKEQTRQEFIEEKIGIKSTKISNSSGEGIYFSRQKGNWVVRLKDNDGNFVNVGQFESEEEAIEAKEEFLNSL